MKQEQQVGEIFSRARPADVLPWTGERMTHDAGMQVELEHLHRYFLARHIAAGLDVLDAATGEGYGSALLAQTARSVVGLDCDSTTVAHAARAYPAANLRFVVGDIRRLPLPDASFDLVVSFETIEHIREHDAFLQEVRRVLRPDGRLLISTPERDTYSPAGRPANPFHVHELSRAEFGALLRRHFSTVSLQGQRPLLGSALFAEDANQAPGLLTFERRGPESFEASQGLPRAVYLLAHASDTQLPALPGSLYVHATPEAPEGHSHSPQADAEERRALEQDIQGLRATIMALRERLYQAEDGRPVTLPATATGQTDATAPAQQARLAELEAYAAHVTEQFQKAGEALTQGAAYARRLEAEVAQQRARADLAEPQLRLLLGSTSWRVTRPLRQIASAFPAAQRLLRRAIRARSPNHPPAPEPRAVDTHRHARVEAVWGSAKPTDARALWSAYPTSHPVVMAAVNRRASGDPQQDGYARLRLTLQQLGYALPLARAASLCCGTGALERRLLAEGMIAHCTGYDLAAGALAQACSEAQSAGLSDKLRYVQRDLEKEALEESGLELVVGHHGVHHLSQLEFVFDNVRAALRPGGIFHLQEFVGPDRFQWTDRQMEEITAWLRSLPEHYRRSATGALKVEAGRPSIDEMLAHDPSEAVRSSAIEPLLAERFEVLERRPLGCTLAMMALADIAHNFDPAVPEDVAHLERLLQREDALIASGEIGSDLLLITARRPG